MKIEIGQEDALIGVDLQIDFMPGGTLAVAEGNQIVPLVNDLLACFPTKVLTRDWHPENHISFSEKPAYKDMSWPPHCVQESRGAEFHPDLNVALAQKVVSKGQPSNREQYSGFQDSTLADWLKARGVRRVFITGLATEYCVKNTALDAKKAGFDTFVIRDGVRGIDLPRGSEALSWNAMEAAGIHLITSEALNACPLPRSTEARKPETVVAMG